MSTPETVIPSSQITATITAAALARYRDDALPDDVYARVADKLAEASREDSSAARVIEDGVRVGAMARFRVPPYPAAHNLGTARMSARAEDGVVSDFGRAYDVPNLFVSDGSVMTTWAAANSMLTIGRWCCARQITSSSR